MIIVIYVPSICICICIWVEPDCWEHFPWYPSPGLGLATHPAFEELNHALTGSERSYLIVCQISYLCLWLFTRNPRRFVFWETWAGWNCFPPWRVGLNMAIIFIAVLKMMIIMTLMVCIFIQCMSCFPSPLQVIIGKLTCEWSKEEFGVMMIMMTTMSTMIMTIKSMMMEA